MNKKIIALLLLLPLTYSISYSEKKKAKNIFILPFSVYNNSDSDADSGDAIKKKKKNISESYKDTLIGQDFTDYMSEVIVEYKDFNLISDEEVKNQEDAIERKMAVSGDDEESVKAIMKMVDSDCIIHGKIIKDPEGNLNIKAVLLDRTNTSLRKTVTITRDRYIDAAAHALAHYLLTTDESYIKKFQKDMKNKEEDIIEAEIERKASLTGIDDDYEGQNACVNNSSFLRIGYGGFSSTSYFFNSKLNDYYPENQAFIADVFLYRSKDTVGDGVDIYSRLFYKKFRADDKSYKKITEDMAAENSLHDDYNDIASKYVPLPVDDLQMVQKGIDLGFRFVGTTYFFHEAWSFYMMFGGRYIQITEKYKSSGGIENEKNFSGTGGTTGVGLEVTLNRYMGLFTEINAAYVPVGDNNVNYDGAQLLVGVTFRSNHIEGPLFGFM